MKHTSERLQAATASPTLGRPWWLHRHRGISKQSIRQKIVLSHRIFSMFREFRPARDLAHFVLIRPCSTLIGALPVRRARRRFTLCLFLCDSTTCCQNAKILRSRIDPATLACAYRCVRHTAVEKLILHRTPSVALVYTDTKVHWIWSCGHQLFWAVTFDSRSVLGCVLFTG